jgi:glycosyltransferase involved in cell wall biosynthesis
MKVTVLIPTRNRALLLKEAIQSVLGQSRPPHEVIVVDDGSDDHTAATIAAFGPPVRGLKQPQGGKSKALNSGYALATGEAAIVLDDDDLLPPLALERHVEALVRSPNADFSYGRFLMFQGDPPTQAPDRSDPRIHPVPTEDLRRTVVKLMEAPFLPHPTWMARRTALDRAGPYDEQRHRSQDYDMLLRLARGNDGVFVDEVVLYQRQHAGARPGVVASGATDVNAAWTLHNIAMLQAIAQTWRPEEFYPYAHAPFPAHAERTGWLQKAVILFNRKCYPEALDALATYRRLLDDDRPDPLEIFVASRMFLREVGSELLGNDGLAKLVRTGLRCQRWCLELRRAFVGSVRWQIRTALNAGDFGQAMGLTRFLMEAFGPLGAAVGIVFKPEAGEQARLPVQPDIPRPSL